MPWFRTVLERNTATPRATGRSANMGISCMLRFDSCIVNFEIGEDKRKLWDGFEDRNWIHRVQTPEV